MRMCPVKSDAAFSLLVLLFVVGITSGQESWTLNTYPGYRKDVTGEEVKVSLSVGTLSGRRRRGDARAGGEFEFADWYLGIPYAKPPVGELRLERPEPAESWTGVRQATRFSPACPQMRHYSYARDHNEDCLYHNVFVPYKAGHDGPFPVMVFIHGGSNMIGSSIIYYGHLLSQHGVVVVTINYRLGILGFLCGMDEALSGNYGIHDQILLLRWVQEHIHHFKGDPDNVTIFGNSAGSADVGLLNLSPRAKGLFHNVIGESGSPLAFWAFYTPEQNITEHAQRVMGSFGCDPGVGFASQVTCMKQRDTETLLSIPTEKWPPMDPSGVDFKPCIDNYLFPEHPLDLLQSGSINARAYMTGTTKDEWTSHLTWLIEEIYKSQPELDHDFKDGLDRETFEVIVKYLVRERFGWPHSLTELVINEYTTWRLWDDPYENRDQYVNFMTDVAMLAPTVRLAEGLTNYHVPTYLYSFQHYAVASKNYDAEYLKAYHSVELNYVFGSPFTGLEVPAALTDEYLESDREMSTMMMKWWTNFAKTGNPNNPGSEDWRRFTLDEADYVALSVNGTDRKMETQNRHHHARMWNYVIPDIIREINGTLDVPTPTQPSTPVHTWILLALCVILIVLLVYCIMRLRKRQRSSY